ncbi:MAG: hypothetical protein AVDCRST_MAG07-2645 [uncultured Frankineae bacterium]|uniref:HNH endonuclease n=1 Tax=uncultured Frankineae bacterium TaxID=437475 RepID=A0A6J4LZA6_9ACTN|nr:MAG: hypothetical protein AVDCRST_MAG07-2645 [uncultured Frankineae bacterium]
MTCGVCGATAAAPAPLTWSTARGPEGRSVCCPSCTRAHVRAMEAKLDEAHW